MANTAAYEKIVITSEGHEFGHPTCANSKGGLPFFFPELSYVSSGEHCVSEALEVKKKITKKEKKK